LILVELELWPNFLLVAKRLGVPTWVVNGRLSERSAARYALVAPLSGALFRLVDAYGVQTEDYATRFRRIGVPTERITVLGNLKYDRAPAPRSVADADGLRQRLGWGRDEGIVLIVAGCTHPGEEKMLAAMMPRLDPEHVRWVLAPRHVERLAAPAELETWDCPRRLVRWSEIRERASGDDMRRLLERGDDVLLVDTVGELERFYAAADMVIVGGSFVPHGGHNMLEPTRLGKPTVFGPAHANFREEANYLLRSDAAVLASDGAELEAQLLEWLGDPVSRRELGQRAAEVTEKLRGALARVLDWIVARRGDPAGASSSRSLSE
jgi:3-deoxy-D-manno-octulosonic-acid transferase